jgi:hypothetical protein
LVPLNLLRARGKGEGKGKEWIGVSIGAAAMRVIHGLADVCAAVDGNR